jgi:hypothetical protein
LPSLASPKSVTDQTGELTEGWMANGSRRGNKFRQLARETENPTTKLLAEGLIDLTEGLGN